MRSKSGADTLKQSEILLSSFPLCVSLWGQQSLCCGPVVLDCARRQGLFSASLLKSRKSTVSLVPFSNILFRFQPAALPHGCYLKKTDLGWSLHEPLLFTKQMQRKPLIWIIACWQSPHTQLMVATVEGPYYILIDCFCENHICLLLTWLHYSICFLQKERKMSCHTIAPQIKPRLIFPLLSSLPIELSSPARLE